MNVLVECEKEQLENTMRVLETNGFKHDNDYSAVPIGDGSTVIIRGDANDIGKIKCVVGVKNVWVDSRVASLRKE